MAVICTFTEKKTRGVSGEFNVYFLSFLELLILKSVNQNALYMLLDAVS